MNNPYTSGVDCVYTTYTGEIEYKSNKGWIDVPEMSVNLNYSGKKIIICTISVAATGGASLGFRFQDDNGTLHPIRTTTNNRAPAHFSVEPPINSWDNLCSWTFQMVADCHGQVKLQMRVDGTFARVNGLPFSQNAAVNHMPISALTVLSIHESGPSSTNNPYASGVDCVYTTYTGEKKYTQPSWVDVTGMSVNLNYSGKKLIICTICLGSASHANVGFRFCDANGVLQPIRTTTSNRDPVHFTAEPPPNSSENLCVWTFHMVADCHGQVKLQIRVDDTGSVCINSTEDQRGQWYNHMTISTLTVLSI